MLGKRRMGEVQRILEEERGDKRSLEGLELETLSIARRVQKEEET
jgi:hypothetical protein